MPAIIGRAILLIGLALLLVLGVPALDEGYTDAGNTTEIANESWTPDHGNWTDLTHSNKDARYDDNVSVYNGTDPDNSSLMAEGTDYEWNSSDGRVKALSGGNLTDGGNASIYYNFTTWTDSQETVLSVVSGAMDVSGLLLLVAAIALLVMGARMLAGIT